MTFRCLIVDDNRSFLEAARVLLEREGLTVVGVTTNGADAISEAEALRPNVILVDISLGTESGFEVTKRLVKEDCHDATVILISTHAEADFADLIAACPVAGFLPKEELSATAIRRIVEGRPR